MRPASIVNFERLYLGALVIGIINTFLTWNSTVEQLRADPATQAVGSNMLVISTIIGIVIPLLLWYFIARKASVIAKWILVILFVIGVVGLIMTFSAGTFPGGIAGVLAVVALLMQAAAIYMLFRPDAKAWFQDGRAEA